MAKARARTTARKVKDRWKAKNWYQILAPTLFDAIPVAETLAESPESLMGRVTEVSLQDITNDFRKSHIKLIFKVDRIEQNKAYTHLKGTILTTDYLRRMIRRRKSRIDGVFDVETRDGALVRVKPFAIAEKRIQSSQKKLIRNVMSDVIQKEGKAKTLNEFIRDCIDGKIGSEIHKNCKIYYPVKRIEINKTEVRRLPTILIEEEKAEPVAEVQEPIKEGEVPTETPSAPSKEEIPKEETEQEAIPELTPEEGAEEKPKKKTRAKKTTTKKKTTVKKSKKKAEPEAKE